MESPPLMPLQEGRWKWYQEGIPISIPHVSLDEGPRFPSTYWLLGCDIASKVTNDLCFNHFSMHVAFDLGFNQCSMHVAVDV
jgi:hypothetical protein